MKAAVEHANEIGMVLDGLATGRDAPVAASWRRCVETYGMDPARDEPAHIVTETELREHRQQAEHLIATARSGLQSLFRQVAGQNYVLLLADAKGVCVDYFGDPVFEGELRRSGLYLGSNWAEDLAGTCGVGACIVTGQPITIHQSDHFGLAHTPLSCTSAPIYDTIGQLAAVLDISLLRSPQPKSSQNLAMSLVTASARRVEMANLMARSRREWVLRLSMSPEFLDVDPEAAITLDGSGRITGYTHGAGALVGTGDGGGVIGRRIDTVMSVSIDDLPDLMRDRPTEERVLELNDGRRLFGHAIAPQVTRSAPRPPVHARPSAFAALAGPDQALDALLAQAERLAATDVAILIAGETGVGKERLARALHTVGRVGGRFVSLAAGGLSVGDLRATVAAVGEARATLFLRAVEDLSPEVRTALPAVLDAHPNLRPVSSTRLDPSALRGEGGLKPELWFRLAQTTLRLPPLRLRADFDWLVDRLLRFRTADSPRLTPAARDALKGRAWGGNIRELAAALDVAVALSDGGVIDVTDLPADPEHAAALEEDLEAMLDACGWNMAEAARRLGVNRSTVLRRMRRAGLAD
ncbi:sigma-54-dependent Fis family transcriptional regulator [Acuticoccus sediminis]|uniref:Sigma-54-dependent Fis family transcriptional regulator n=1 Tax=Acuticoccus sediminis TaxID=2184697 RepID=A0A8B2P350_9HYPH|nr:sigma-54-dependent Fis family transcriptional regulator [Acuticoccus sediminis]RAI03562.1 sigma-54-dependent Fis family transcriptional regulator [Acuticoccus sediminis]